MKVEFTYDPEFNALMEGLEQKYGQTIMQLEGLDGNLDINRMSETFFTSSTVDVSVDPNANVDDDTVLAYTVELGKPFLRLNSLYKMWRTIKRLYNSEVAAAALDAEVGGDVYTHDLTGYGIRSYCWAMSVMDIVNRGLPFINRVKSVPAQHLTTFVQHVIQSIMYMSNQIDGAVAIPDLIVAMSYFVNKDIKEGLIPDPIKDPKGYRKIVTQQMQIFIYTINQPVRSGQSPYTNISIFDDTFMHKLFGDLVYPDGSSPDFNRIKELQCLFLDIMEEEMNRQILTFPVITAAMTVETTDGTRKILHPEFLSFIAKYSLPHANFNIYIGEVTSLSSCCRLRNNITNEHMNSLGAANSLKIGSHRVVTMNLPRVALCSSTKEELFENLGKLMDKARNILKAHRYIVRDIINKGRLPLYNFELMDLNRQYSTFGMIGIYEMVELMGYDPISADGQAVTKDILHYMNQKIDGYNEVVKEKTYLIYFKDGTKLKRVVDAKLSIIRKGIKQQINISELKYNDIYKQKRIKEVQVHEEDVIYVYNLEQVPGETAAVKLLKKDKIVFGLKELDKYQLYSNQFVPLHADVPISTRMAIHGHFDSDTSGGAILHLNVSEKIKDEAVMERLIYNAVMYGVVYFAINYNFQKCENGHYVVSNGKTCPECGSKIVEEYTRVVGYITPKKNWSREKRDEKRVFKGERELIE